MLSLLHCSISVFLALYPWVTWQLSSLCENTQLSLPCSSFSYAALAWLHEVGSIDFHFIDEKTEAWRGE